MEVGQRLAGSRLRWHLREFRVDLSIAN
jgi:hypothetical protein